MKYFIVGILLFLSSFVWSQSITFSFRGRIENLDLGKNEGGVTVAIVQNGSTIASSSTSSNGKYTLKGDVNYSSPFDVVFSKAGFVSKKVNFDFSSLNEEDTPASAEYAPVDDLSMSIFKERETADFSFLDSEPVAKFAWDNRKLAPNLDNAQASRMRNKIDALLKEAENAAEKLEADYQAAIKAGDDAFAAEKYEEALAKFEEALTYKPSEKYPNDKILELDALIAAQRDQELAEKQANQEYFNLIEAADNLRDAGDIEKAITKYNEASSMRPEEQYPKDQAATLQDQLDKEAEAKANEEAYQAAIKAGDVFMKQNSLRPARDKFEAASKLKPEESYPKEKLKEIEEKMAELEEREAKKAKYEAAIEEADKAYDAEDYQAAKDKYEEALTFESASTYAKGRIEMCNEELANSQAEAERLAKIQELLDKGNADLEASKYEDAVTAFTEVLTLDASNAEATAKLAEAQKKIEELANEAEREKQYAAFIEEGDQANTAEKLEDALSKYEAAKALKDTPEVNDKIEAVQDAINLAKAQADKEANYNALITEAEAKFATEDLQGAIDKYNEASAVDPSQSEPAEKIAEIQAMLDEQAANAAKEEQFSALMKQGNDLLAANDLENAKSKFQEAQKVNPSSTEPQVKIDEIDTLIAQNAEEQAKNEAFAALMKEGNDLMAADNLDQAKSKFQEALTVDPSRTEPQAKLDEIEALIVERAANEAEQERQEELTAAIDAADNFFNEAKWDDSKEKYREALAIDPNNQYAKDRISQIDIKVEEERVRQQVELLLADAKSLRESDKLEDARSKYQEVLAFDPSNQEATAQIDEINAALAAMQNEEQKEEAFAVLKEEGMQLLQDEKLQEAKQKLNEALSYKEDAEVKQTIQEIDDLIAEKAKAEALALEQAELDAKYDGFIQDAEAKETSKNYAAAISAYKKAGEVKPEEALPKQKVEELTALLAEQQTNASQNEKYDNFIAEAASFEENGDLESAIASYEKAKGVRPEEELPKSKIAELQAKIESDAARQAEIDQEYQEAMDRGEQLMASENYLEAINAFNEALALKPTESLPKERAAAAEEAERKKGDGNAVYEKILAAAEGKLESGDYDKAEELIGRAKQLKPEDERPQELLKRVEELRAKDNKYANLMASGDAEAGNKNYKEAIAAYKKAKSLKPSESLPGEKIEEMNRLLEDASSETQKEELYTSYMQKGQAATTGDKFQEALGHYQNALSVKPGDQEAQDKLNEIQQILDDIANATEEKQEKKAKFDALIKEGEKLFAEEKYLEAKDKFDAALTVDPYSSFAKEKSDESAKLAEAVGREEAEKQYQKLLKVADKSFDDEDWDKAKDYYNRASGMRKSDPYPKKRLEEIELILNPPVAQSANLEPLGEAYDGSIEDGSFILIQSEETRKRSKGLKIKAELDKANASQSGIAAANQNERLDTQNEIYAIWEKVAVSTDGANDSREETIQKLRNAEETRETRAAQDAAFEKGDNLSAQEKMNLAKGETVLSYMEGEDRRKASVEKVKGIQVAHQEDLYRQGEQYTQRKYDTDLAMDQIVIDVEAEQKDDYAERLEIERKVDKAADETTGIYQSISDNRYDASQKEKARIVQIESQLSSKATEDAKVAKDNNEEVRGVREDVDAVALAYMQQNDEQGKKVDAQIAEVERRVISDNTGFDKVRKEANDRLKDIQSEKVASDIEASEGQTEKYRANKELLSEEERKRKDAGEKADVAMSNKIAYVKAKDEEARSKASQGQLSDDAERLNARQKIVNQEIAKSAKTDELKEATEDNTESIKDVQKASAAKATAEGRAQRDKNLDAQQSLNKIETGKPKKVKIANELGQEYPEGVTQEMFTRKDEAGLVTTVITRRIVVIDGHADVYVRTETKNGITYSKNSKPSLSHVWNSETQGPHLERHY
ncbi:MAG: hypothetical protein CSA03_03975 [Bacteroidetes bacterium]|nr:MAG: hypothetical protein CSA03_03975 [Bacteroidota bacterium]